MNKIIYVSEESITNDLKEMQEQFGKELVLLLLAKIISNNYWWNWPEMKEEIYSSLNQGGSNEQA